MKREQQLQQRLRTLHTLDEALSAMKALSAHHFLKCREILPAAREYRTVLERAACGAAILRGPQSAAPPALLLVVSDLGLCGPYNDRLVEALLSERKQQGEGPFYCVGRRSRAALERAGLTPTRLYEVPASAEGLPTLLLDLARDLLADYGAQRVGSLAVVSARFDGAGRFSPLVTRVLPVTLPAADEPLRPTGYESPEHLSLVAVRELLYTTLYELMLDAIAAEHGMRLVAVESALEWLEKMTELVQRRLRAFRREATTQEVLDIVAGAGGPSRRERLNEQPRRPPSRQESARSRNPRLTVRDSPVVSLPLHQESRDASRSRAATESHERPRCRGQPRRGERCGQDREGLVKNWQRRSLPPRQHWMLSML